MKYIAIIERSGIQMPIAIRSHNKEIVKEDIKNIYNNPNILDIVPYEEYKNKHKLFNSRKALPSSNLYTTIKRKRL
jgi:hypothetical protein